MFHCDQQGVVEANEYHTKNEGKTKSKQPNWSQNHYVIVFDQRELRGVVWNEVSLKSYLETLNSPCKV